MSEILDRLRNVVKRKSEQQVIQPIVVIDKSNDFVEYVKKTDILMGRDKEYPLTEQMQNNLDKLHKALNKLGAAYGKLPPVSSGYRPGKYNMAAGGAKNSGHLICKACDFKDGDGAFDKWCSENQKILEGCGLWQEHPDNTKGWCHLDIIERPARPKGTAAFRTFKP
ncbi:MAG: D-Ala-D-Ala carboxypeptidase family metallohydrolase [Thermoplasmatales archaeon]